MTFDELLRKYQSTKSDPFAASGLLYLIPAGGNNFKGELIELLGHKIKNKDSEDLEFYLALAHQDGMDGAYKPILKELVLATWHQSHEDIVSYIGDLRDDDFTDDLYTIAITPEPYRQYDDELEATLRKCIHALKAINSNHSNERLEQLKATGNENVHYALEQ
ncbi:MAG TPA: hypothetical protein VL095_09875 [Flavisolibacter sp.]|nr:hypothetical protein [Flavisolibacter sp.]